MILETKNGIKEISMYDQSRIRCQNCLKKGHINCVKIMKT